MPLTASTETRTVTVDGAEVTYFDSVETHDGHRPLVLVHGTSGSTATHYGQIFPMLATRTRVISADWSPLADPSAPLTVEALADQVMAAVNDAIGEEPFDLVGYSLGAAVAEYIAATQGERVPSLVLLAGWITTDGHQKLRNGVWRTLYEEKSEAIRHYMAFCAFSPNFVRKTDPNMVEAAIAALPINEFVAAQMDLNGRVDISDVIGNISATTLVVAGAEDMMVPKHHSRALFGVIPDARYTETSTGHGIPMERPTEVVQLIDLFIRDPHRYPAGTIIPETHA